MKKFEITEEQIRRIHECTSVGNREDLEEWFPEAFEPKLEVGNWYVASGDKIGLKEISLLVHFSGEKYNNYGFDFLGNWCDNLGILNSLKDVARLATHEEVKEALVKEAMKRYKLPQKIKYLDGENKTDELLGYDLTYRNNKLGASGGDNDLLFKDGVWAEIVKEPVTLNYQQIADKFGIDVEQLRITK